MVTRSAATARWLARSLPAARESCKAPTGIPAVEIVASLPSEDQAAFAGWPLAVITVSACDIAVLKTRFTLPPCSTGEPGPRLAPASSRRVVTRGRMVVVKLQAYPPTGFPRRSWKGWISTRDSVASDHARAGT